MNLLDIIVLAVLAFFAIKGLTRGLINEVSSLIGLVLGVFFAYKLYPVLAAPLQKVLHIPLYVSMFLAFLFILIAIGVVAHIVGNIITTTLKLVMLGSINRLGGIGIGLLEGVLLLSLCFSALTADFMPETIRSKIRSSESANLFATTGSRILAAWHSSQTKAP